MTDGAESIDFWDVLDEAEQTVEKWPSWQQDVEADVYYDGDSSAPRAIANIALLPAVMMMRHAHSALPS